MVAPSSKDQWSPTAWPVSFRWRLLAAAVVVVLTVLAIVALSGDSEDVAEVPVVAAASRWPEGHPPGEYAIVNVPSELAPLFVGSVELDGTVASVAVPQGTLISPQMLRPRQDVDNTRTTALLQFNVNAQMWPEPGPAAGDWAVFSTSPGGCATALVTLVAVVDEGSGALVTLESSPELAGILADEQWWIWESPPIGWPPCEDADPAAAPLAQSTAAPASPTPIDDGTQP